MSQTAERTELEAQKPLRVIIVSDFAANTGGAAKVALTEAAGLARRGHRVTLLAGQGQPDPELVAAGVEVRSTGQHTTLEDPNRARAAMLGIWNRRSAALMRELTGAADPRHAVVHVHGFTKVLSASVIRAAVRSGVPTLATLHDYFAACPNGGFYNYQRNEICHLVPLSPQCLATNCDARSYSHKLWRAGRTAVQRRAGAMPGGLSHFVFPSQFAAGIMRPFLPAGARAHVLSTPISVRRREPAGVEANDAFVFAGRLQRDKDPVTFARAARKAGVRAVFAGSGELGERVRAECPGAELTGWLDSEELQMRIRSARALVCPSSWYEVQPAAPVEAAAQGVPAIVSDAGAFKEVVEDQVTGLWFRSGDVDDLAAKLRRLHEEPQLAGALGRAAYERFWAQDWSVETHLSRLESIYRSLLAT